MKILYDDQIFISHKFGGISRYFCELMRNSNGLFDYDVTGLYFENEYTKTLPFYKAFPLKFNFKGKMRIIKIINKLNQKIKIKLKNYDIIHPTYYDPYFLKKIIKSPLTIPSNENIYKRILQFNQNIILRNNYEIQKNIEDIPHKDEAIPEKKEKQNYILFTGNRDSYKNFYSFIEAVSPLLIRYNLQLICTGSPFNNDEADFLSRHKIHDRTICKFVPESGLQDIYAKALLFVFPSLYEGFGFPILEAFSSGCPVLLSNTSCFPEIAKDAAIYFDPYSVEDMRRIIEKVLLNSFLQLELIKKGYERLKYFSWKKTAEQTYNLYCKTVPPLPPLKYDWF